MRIALAACCLLVAPRLWAGGESTPVDGPYDVTFSMPKAGAVQVLLDWQNGAGLALGCTGKGATLNAVSKRGKGQLAAVTGAVSGTVRVRRRQSLVEIETAGRVLLRTYVDRTIAGAVMLAPGASGPELHVQPVEPAAFHDEFFDPEGGESVWEPVSGQWSIGTYRDPLKALENRPIAASWYQVTPNGQALSLTGQDFWEHYRVRTAVLAVPGVRAGLVFYAQDANNYCVFSVRPGSGEQGIAELTTVSQGKPKTTALPAPPFAWRLGNWHELALQVDDGAIRCSVDGTRLGDSSIPCAGGKVGLLAEGKGEVRFDDFDVRPARWCREADSTRRGDWSGAQGAWDTDCGYLNGRAQAFSPCLWLKAADANALRVDLRSARGPSGLLLNWRNDSGYRLSMGPTGCALERVTDGKAVTLASAAGKGRPGRLTLSHLAGRLSAATPGGWLSCYDFTYRGGACGVFTDGEARFSSAEASGDEETPTVISTVTGVPTPMPGENSDTSRFVLGYVWRPNGGTWTGAGPTDNRLLSARAYGQQPASLWYYSPCPGDAVMTVEGLQLHPGGSGGVAIACDSHGYTLGSGYRAETDGKALRLFRAEKAVTEKPLPKPPATLRLWRDGRFIVALADGTPLVFDDPQPLPGSLCAAYATGAGWSARQVTLAHRRASVYAFKSEETDWQPVSGEWGTHTGMACIAWDYWYTAKGQPQALACHVQPRLNVRQLDVWVSEYSEGYEDREHKHFPCHDISLVMNAEQAELDGGYRFLIAGEGGTVTRLLRLGQVVAETRDPAFAVRMGGHCNSPRDLHLVVQRKGAQLTLTINGRQALDWTDPQPLGPGRLGIGTADCTANFRDLWIVRE
ncbi:hypothetical protein LLH23_18425 [bacterium]|nr:hypothetical protein [bacterium]